MEFERAFVLEHEGYAAAVAQRTAAFVEVHPHIGHRAVGVVRRSLHEESDTVRAVSFVNDLLVVGGILLGGALDRTLHFLLRDVLRLGVLDENAQPRVRRRIGTRGFHSDFDLLAELGERAGHMSPTLQFAGLTVFKCSSHSGYALFIFFIRSAKLQKINDFAYSPRKNSGSVLRRHTGQRSCTTTGGGNGP